MIPSQEKLEEIKATLKSGGKVDFPDLPPELQNARTQMLKNKVKPEEANTNIALAMSDFTRLAAERGQTLEQWLKENPFEVRYDKAGEQVLTPRKNLNPEEQEKVDAKATAGMTDAQKMEYFSQKGLEQSEGFKGSPAYRDLKDYLRKNPLDSSDKGGLTGEAKELRKEWLTNSVNPDSGKVENLSDAKRRQEPGPAPP